MAESEKPRDMFDTALQGLKPGLKVVGTMAEEIVKQSVPGAKIVAGEALQRVGKVRRRTR